MKRCSRFLISMIILALALMACGESTPVTSTASTPQPTTVKATPTQKTATNALTATSGPTRLGSPLSDFVGRYGQPNDHTDAKNGDYHFARYAGENTDSIILQTDIFDGGKYEQSVMNVDASAPESGWKVSDANTLCATFYPTDARYKSKMDITLGNGYDEIYSSASLASLFPADAFDDSNNVQTTAGLFDVQFLTRPDGTIDSCNIQIGTQQAQ